MNINFKFHTARNFIIMLLLVFVVNGIIENILIKRKIKQFTRDCVLVYEDTENGIRLYNVSRETSQSSLTLEDDKYYIGQQGDILLKKSSPFSGFPVIHELTGFFFGGHAGIVSDDIKETIEVVGNDENNKVSYYENDWFDLKECIGVRLKDTSHNSDILNNVKDKIGKKYNYSFIFDNGYYCTDLITKSIYDETKIDLNDFGLVTVNDIILSKNVEICYYQYINSDGIKCIYFIK